MNTWPASQVGLESRTAAISGGLLAPQSPRLAHRRRLPGGGPRPGPVVHPPRRHLHQRVLHQRPGGAVVAGGHQHGGDHLLDRHAQPGGRPGAPRRRGGQLGVVGVPVLRPADRVLLRADVAAQRRAHRPGILRTALRRQARGLRARFSRPLPRAALQRRHHGHRHPGDGQDRQRAAGLGAVDDRAGVRGDLRRLLLPERAVGRAGGGSRAVRDRHDRAGRGSLRGGGETRSGGPCRHRLAARPAHPLAAARLPRPRRLRAALHRAARGAVVGHLVSRLRARRRQLHRPAHARGARRAPRPRRDAVVQRRALRAAALAVDPGRPRLAAGVPDPGRRAARAAARRPRADRPRHRLSRDADLPAARPAGAGGGGALRGLRLHDVDPPQLGRELPGARLLPSFRAAGRHRAALRRRVAAGHGGADARRGRRRLGDRDGRRGLPAHALDRRRHRACSTCCAGTGGGSTPGARSRRWPRRS